MAVPLSLPSLPEDLFHLIGEHLDSTDIVICRFVSKTWHGAFTNPYFLRAALKKQLGNAREARKLRYEGAFTGPIDRAGRDPTYWVRVFDRVAARYYALGTGTPQHITKLSQYVSTSGGWPAHYYPISQWSHSLIAGTPGASRIFLQEHKKEQAWTYDDGLLVYADKKAKGYVLLDIQDTTNTNVPFELRGRCVRRIRLRHRVLVIEWAEATAYHNLNETESVHRHFVTAFDVLRVPKSLPWLPKWSITCRNEWKLHFLGLPLNQGDRFFSIHTATHYAVYIWQPNRSAWGEDTPLELLAVWDISHHCEYRPSEDPSGQAKPEFGPCIILKASYKLLDFYGIRQRDNPRFQKLRLDEGEGMVYFHEGQGLSGFGSLRNDSDRHWEYTGNVVGIPFAGIGPAWRYEVSKRWNLGTKSQLEMLPFSSLREETCIEPMQSCEYNRQVSFLWILRGACLRGFRDCLAGINIAAGEPYQDEVDTASWTMHIWGNEWNAQLKQSVSESLKYSCIRGDERWIIGRSQANEIVILHFDKKSSKSKPFITSCFAEFSANANQILVVSNNAFENPTCHHASLSIAP